MNFKQQLQEAYEAGYRQSLQEAVDDAYEAYERGEINEEQLDEIVGLITRGISAIPKIGKGLKKGYDFVRKSFRRPVKKRGTPGVTQHLDPNTGLPKPAGPDYYPTGHGRPPFPGDTRSPQGVLDDRRKIGRFIDPPEPPTDYDPFDPLGPLLDP
jgi:hypothetical protein|tara:strand:+ start:3239 stop:3703 length:465 start_codon:yes stop_codon:yes gene_type:complete